MPEATAQSLDSGSGTAEGAVAKSLTFEEVQEQRRSARAAAMRALASAQANECIEAEVDSLGDAGSGDRRRAQATTSSTPGPSFPVNPDDEPPNEALVFATLTANVTSVALPPLMLVPDGGCNASAAALCPAVLSDCFCANPEDRTSACQCFFTSGQCYRQAGCTELIPQADMDFCFYRLFCGSMDQCEGNGARALKAGVELLLFVLVGSVAVLVGL